MSEVKKIATRDSYGNALVELAQGGAHLGVEAGLGIGRQDDQFVFA